MSLSPAEPIFLEKTERTLVFGSNDHLASRDQRGTSSHIQLQLRLAVTLLCSCHLANTFTSILESHCSKETSKVWGGRKMHRNGRSGLLFKYMRFCL